MRTCSGPCQQGRLSCPCPEACEAPGPNPLTGWRMAVAAVAIGGISVLAAVAVLVAFGQILALYLY